MGVCFPCASKLMFRESCLMWGISLGRSKVCLQTSFYVNFPFPFYASSVNSELSPGQSGPGSVSFKWLLPSLVCACMLRHFRCVWLYATLWTAAHQVPLSLGILQARILEWVAISFSRRSFWLRDRTHVSCISRRILYHWPTWESPRKTYPTL